MINEIWSCCSCFDENEAFFDSPEKTSIRRNDRYERRRDGQTMVADSNWKKKMTMKTCHKFKCPRWIITQSGVKTGKKKHTRNLAYRYWLLLQQNLKLWTRFAENISSKNNRIKGTAHETRQQRQVEGIKCWRRCRISMFLCVTYILDCTCNNSCMLLKQEVHVLL